MTTPTPPVLIDVNKPADPGDLWIERVGCWVLTPDTIAITPIMRQTIVHLRTKAGLSQAALAADLGVTREWLSHIEIGLIQTISSSRYDDILDICTDVMRGTVAA